MELTEIIAWLIAHGLPFAVSLALGELAALIVGGVGSGAVAFGLIDDLLAVILKQGLSTWEGFNLSILIDEAEKIHHEAMVYADEDDRQRAARHAALVRWHGDKVYLFGDVSVADFVRTGYSAYVVGQSDLVQSIAGWVSDGWEVAAEGIELVAL